MCLFENFYILFHRILPDYWPTIKAGKIPIWTPSYFFKENLLYCMYLFYFYFMVFMIYFIILKYIYIFIMNIHYKY